MVFIIPNSFLTTENTKETQRAQRINHSVFSVPSPCPLWLKKAKLLPKSQIQKA